MGKASRVCLTCDRCGCTVYGLESDEATAGFYRRSEYSSKYLYPDEEVVCDDCMWDDPRYRADYN